MWRIYQIIQKYNKLTHINNKIYRINKESIITAKHEKHVIQRQGFVIISNMFYGRTKLRFH